MRGYKCSPPLLDGPRNDKDIATSAILNNTRYSEYRIWLTKESERRSFKIIPIIFSEKLTMHCPGRFPSRLWAETLTSSNPCWELLTVSNQQWLRGTLCSELNSPAKRFVNLSILSNKYFLDLCWFSLAGSWHLLPSSCPSCYGTVPRYQWSVAVLILMFWHHNTMFAGNAKWGPTEKCLEVRRPGEIFIHQPAQTHMMVVPGDTMINFSLDNFFHIIREWVYACCLCLDWGWTWWKVGNYNERESWPTT